MKRPFLHRALQFFPSSLQWEYVSTTQVRVREIHFPARACVALRAFDRRIAVKRYGYARDPVCIVACACYACNRWLLPIALRGAFMRNYFSDLLLIPAALPLVLWLQRRLGLRSTDMKPQKFEIVLHLTVWSVAAELIAPHLFTRATGDPWDVVAYAGGALASGLIWRMG